MSLQLPEPLSDYFEASNAHDSDGLIACFDADATVHDEDKDVRGLRAIHAWNEENIRKYQFTTTPNQVKKMGDLTIVTAQVAGNFDGSPVELDFSFKLADAKIHALEIG